MSPPLVLVHVTVPPFLMVTSAGPKPSALYVTADDIGAVGVGVGVTTGVVSVGDAGAALFCQNIYAPPRITTTTIAQMKFFIHYDYSSLSNKCLGLYHI